MSLRLAAVCMMRNDGDIIHPFLRHCAEFFDELIVADVGSTDGTAEVLRSFSDPRLNLTVYRVDRQEKYQAALLNLISRQAFERGADWVFCLDGDEFIGANSRAELEQSLLNLGSDVMKMLWLNLVPTKFGTFNSFDIGQEFRWSGRASPFSKIAISRLYAANYPDYTIHEGSHAVTPVAGAPANAGLLGVPLLHVPIRCRDRLSYKVTMALRLVRAKHNRFAGEGSHVDTLVELLEQGAIGVPELRQLAATYGGRPEHLDGIDPEALGWPVRRLPSFMHEPSPGHDSQSLRSLPETLAADEALIWKRNPFAPGSQVGALQDGDLLQIVPQVLHGNGSARRTRFAALPPATVPERFGADWLTDVVSASTNPISVHVFSAWTRLVPVMSALMTLLRPRRYVELGVHNGMSFFSACDIAKKRQIPVECVAVDSWQGDDHAGLYTGSVFDEFRAHISANFPHQHYVQGYFDTVLDCFETGSVDLLHIDGLHTHEAVKEDFETWLPKMSDVGVIIFHDTNVLERGFGVWRLWEELKARYPAFHFAHQHGLGIIYVGQEPHPFASLLRQLSANWTEGTLAQAYFEATGNLLVAQAAGEHAIAVLQAAGNGPSGPQGQAASPAPGDAAEHAHLQARYDAMVNSTSWRITAPVRAALDGLPAARQLARRTVKGSWWLVTGQLPARYRMYRAAKAAAASRQDS